MEREKNKVLTTRFMEQGQWFIRVYCKRDEIEKCAVNFDGQPLLTKDKGEQWSLIRAGGNENFRFKANSPDIDNDREIIVTERGKKRYHKKFKELDIER